MAKTRTPMAANTKKAQRIDAAEYNMMQNLRCASEHIPAPISSLSTPEERRRRMYYITKPTVEERFYIDMINKARG